MSMSTRRAATAGTVALLLGGTVLAAPASAAPKFVKCGTVITANTTLRANIGPCSDDGLIIGADNITLDLGGFAVQGRPNRSGDGIGILLQGRTGVTVKNGRVTDFDAGVGILGGSGNTLELLLVKDNIGTTKRGDFGDGIAISSSSGNTVRSNNIIHNGPYDGIGLFGPSSDNVLENNVISGNDITFTADDGIRIEGPNAARNQVRGNTVTASTLDGIAVFASTGNTENVIERNLVAGNGFGLLGARPGDGIRAFQLSNKTTIRNNTVTDNAGSGILVVNRSTGNLITGNVARGNARQAGTLSRYDLHDQSVVPGSDPAIPSCDGNVWVTNVYGTAFPACAGED